MRYHGQEGEEKIPEKTLCQDRDLNSRTLSPEPGTAGIVNLTKIPIMLSNNTDLMMCPVKLITLSQPSWH